jgi:flap endonuclease-1
MAKAVKGTVRVLPKHNDEAKKLLRLMGIPVVEAPTEAEVDKMSDDDDNDDC